jgi:type I restriction enzyme S subunit
VKLADVLTERRESPSDDDLVSGRVKIVEKIGFSEGRIQLRLASHTKTGMILIRPGDLVVSGINAAKGAIAVYDESNEMPLAATIHYGAYIPEKEKVDVAFLWWLLRSGVFRDLLNQYVPGGIKTELKAKRLLPIPVPLPSLNEQRRLVARIVEIAAHINQARTLRQQSSAETHALIGSELGAIFTELSKKHPVLPLGELSSHILDGPHITPHYLPVGAPGFPFVTVKNMVTGKLDFTDLNFVSGEDHRLFTRRCRPERGDVLYSKDGATRGHPCLVDTDREFSFFVSVALIKPLRDRLNSQYLVYLLRSNWIRDRMASKSRGDMIPHIVLREIRAFPIPIPSLAEQGQIVVELDKLQAEIARLKCVQAETEAEINALLPSLLSKAFSGEL